MTLAARTRLRLLLRDLSAGFAFLAMAVSGQVPSWALVCFALGMAFAVLGKRPLAGRTTLSTLVLMVGAALLYASVAAGRLDLVVAACTFAGLLTLHRMLAPPSPTADHQVHLTSLLMVAGGAALSGELLFAVCLVCFAGMACVSQGLGVVDAAAGGNGPVPSGPLLRLLGFAVLLSLLGGMLFFVIFPRLSWNVVGRRGGLGLGAASSGFSGKVTLGGSGTLKTNPRIVLRAELTPEPAGSNLGAYWVGRRLTDFDGTEWTHAAVPKRAVDQVVLSHGGGQLLLQRIELLPAYGNRTLVGVDAPVQFAAGVLHLPGRDAHARLAEVPPGEVRFEADAASYAYQVYSRRTAGSAAPDALSETERRAALQLPPRLDSRVAALASRIRGAEADPARVAARLESYLKGNFRYTLELSGNVADPLAHFLFERQAGHCEHFATALAVLLRTQGIPSRVVTGFYGGERVGGEYVVRAGDAHAWVEAFIPGRGFIRLDATPEASRGAQANRLLSWFLASYEYVESRWQRSVLDYSFRDQADLARQVAATGPGWRMPTGLNGSWKSTLILLGAAALAVVLVARWRAQRTGPRGEATRLRADAEALLLRHHAPTTPASLEDSARRLLAEGHPVGPALHQLARRYLEARFGPHPLQRGERRALVRSLRAGLRGLPTGPGA